jgi:hypothetical protein
VKVTDSRLRTVVGLCAVGGLLLVGSLPALAAPYARPSSITLSDLYLEADIPLVRPDAVRWHPPSAEYIAAHAAEPEHPNMRSEFGVWLPALLAAEWIPPDLVERAPYLRRGEARESRWYSHFYAAYALAEHEFIVQGFLDFVQVTIKPPFAPVPEAVAGPFAEAAALRQTGPPGQWALGVDYRSAATRDLKEFLRKLAERYVNPLSAPSSEQQWDQALSGVSATNAGFWIGWGTQGHKAYLPPNLSADSPALRRSVSCSLWTNGRVVKLTLDHCDIWAHSFEDWLETFPKPVVASVAPLNPEAVELWDMRHWKDECGPVSDEDRAVYDMIQVLVKQPYAPNVGIEMSGEWAGGQPWWGNQVKLPMTELKWHIAEFAALLDGTHIHVERHRYPKNFASQLSSASDRAAFLEEAEGHREALAEAVNRFRTLRYPLEVQEERDEMLAALRDGVRLWDVALALWEPAVQQHPEASETFYELRGRALEEDLAASGLAGANARMGKAARAGVPLFERFGLQQAAG